MSFSFLGAPIKMTVVNRILTANTCILVFIAVMYCFVGPCMEPMYSCNQCICPVSTMEHDLAWPGCREL